MNALARLLSVYLVMVLADSALGFGVYRSFVHAGSGAYCFVTQRNPWEREACTDRVFHSNSLWLLISLAMGLAAGYVTLQAFKTGKW